jgi:hypothetical protein
MAFFPLIVQMARCQLTSEAESAISCSPKRRQCLCDIAALDGANARLQGLKERQLFANASFHSRGVYAIIVCLSLELLDSPKNALLDSATNSQHALALSLETLPPLHRRRSPAKCRLKRYRRKSKKPCHILFFSAVQTYCRLEYSGDPSLEDEDGTIAQRHIQTYVQLLDNHQHPKELVLTDEHRLSFSDVLICRTYLQYVCIGRST